MQPATVACSFVLAGLIVLLSACGSRYTIYVPGVPGVVSGAVHGTVGSPAAKPPVQHPSTGSWEPFDCPQTYATGPLQLNRAGCPVEVCVDPSSEVVAWRDVWWDGRSCDLPEQLRRRACDPAWHGKLTISTNVDGPPASVSRGRTNICSSAPARH